MISLRDNLLDEACVAESPIAGKIHTFGATRSSSHFQGNRFMSASLNSESPAHVIPLHDRNRRKRPHLRPDELAARLVQTGRRADYAYFVKYPAATFGLRTTLSEEAVAALELAGQAAEPWCSDELIVVSAFIRPAKTVIRRFIFGEKWTARGALDVRTRHLETHDFGANFFASSDTLVLNGLEHGPLRRHIRYGRCVYQDTYFGPAVLAMPSPVGVRHDGH
jgi:hypothetical protein